MDGATRLRLVQALQAFLQGVRRLRTMRETDRLLMLLGGIADPELRLHRFGEHLKGHSPEEAAWTFSQVWDRVVAGDRLAQAVSLGLFDPTRLARVLSADQPDAVRGALEADRHPSAGLLAPPQPRAGEPEDETAPRPKEAVGFRVSLARRSVPSLMERLLFDPDPRVVRTLLGNPRLTEAEVVKLAASRRATSGVLEAIAQDDRWITRYPVKVALANNPATPTRVVVGLLPYLLRQDLQALASASPSGAVREQATTLLNRQPGI